MLREQLLEYKIYKERRKKQKRNNRKVAGQRIFLVGKLSFKRIA